MSADELDELDAEAKRLLDTLGEWFGGLDWWRRAGYTDCTPPLTLVNAVKLEQARRKPDGEPDTLRGKDGAS